MLNLQGESIPIIESYSSKVKEKLLFNNVQESILSSANYKIAFSFTSAGLSILNFEELSPFVT